MWKGCYCVFFGLLCGCCPALLLAALRARPWATWVIMDQLSTSRHTCICVCVEGTCMYMGKNVWCQGRVHRQNLNKKIFSACMNIEIYNIQMLQISTIQNFHHQNFLVYSTQHACQMSHQDISFSPLLCHPCAVFIGNLRQINLSGHLSSQLTTIAMQLNTMGMENTMLMNRPLESKYCCREKSLRWVADGW